MHRALLEAVAIERALAPTGPGAGADVGRHGNLERAAPVQQIDAVPALARPLPTQEELVELAEHLNDRNRTSKNAQRDCTELFQAIYVAQQVPEPEQAAGMVGWVGLGGELGWVGVGGECGGWRVGCVNTGPLGRLRRGTADVSESHDADAGTPPDTHGHARAHGHRRRRTTPCSGSRRPSVSVCSRWPDRCPDQDFNVCRIALCPSLALATPRLGIRGQVVLREVDGTVRLPLSAVQPDAPPATWVAGAELSQPTPTALRVAYPAGSTHAAGALDLALFDYVTVSLRVSTTAAHRPAVLLDLVRKSGGRSTRTSAASASATSSGRISLGALQAAETRDAAAARAGDADALQAARELYGQTPEARSLYAVLERMHRLALTGDEP